MMTDPIADLLTRIRNGSSARHLQCSVPWSRLKENLCRLLVDEGYIQDMRVEGELTTKKITISLRYTDAGRPVIVGIRRRSKPGLRVYTGSKDAPRIRNGLGVSVLSTPVGLLSDREARRRNVGGEVLCEVW